MQLSQLNRALALLVLLLLAVYVLRRSTTAASATSHRGPSGDVSQSKRYTNSSDIDYSAVGIASVAVGPKARFFAAYLVRSFVRNAQYPVRSIVPNCVVLRAVCVYVCMCVPAHKRRVTH